MLPELGDLLDGCAFAVRCDRATDVCTALPPVADGTACHHPHTRREDANLQGTRKTTGPASRAVELCNITAGYDRRAPVLRNVSLTVAPSESLGLLGPSGCGKSTLARVVALLHRPLGDERMRPAVAGPERGAGTGRRPGPPRPAGAAWGRPRPGEGGATASVGVWKA